MLRLCVYMSLLVQWWVWLMDRPNQCLASWMWVKVVSLSNYFPNDFSSRLIEVNRKKLVCRRRYSISWGAEDFREWLKVTSKYCWPAEVVSCSVAHHWHRDTTNPTPKVMMFPGQMILKIKRYFLPLTSLRTTVSWSHSQLDNIFIVHLLLFYVHHVESVRKW